jgi:outer membrane protein OmpA-like peptidoglycan-associated protein
MGKATLENSSKFVTGKESISYKVPAAHIGFSFKNHNEPLNAYAKLGIASIANKASNKRVPFIKENTIQLGAGVGAQWQFPNTGVFARLDADYFSNDAFSTNLMLGYRFGASNKSVRHSPKKRPNKRVSRVKRKPVKNARALVRHKPIVKKRVIKKPVRKIVSKVVKQPAFAGVLRGVTFQRNSGVLTVHAKNVLKGVAQKLKRNPKVKVALIGHTDSRGDANKNLRLSQQRAASVKRFLIVQGVKAHRMVSEGRGELQPRANNATEQGRKANRRVELRAL